MRLTEFYRNGYKVVYSTTVGEINYYFYDGFDSKDDVIEAIVKSTNYISDRELKKFLNNGIWSQIIK